MIKLINIYEGTRCWKGYEKKGMKTLFGKRVPNCVKKEEISIDEILDIVSEETGLAAPYGSGYEEVMENLRNWVKQRWVDISRKKKGGGHPACGASAGKKSRKGGKRAYPKCVPASKAARMSKNQCVPVKVTHTTLGSMIAPYNVIATPVIIATSDVGTFLDSFRVAISLMVTQKTAAIAYKE